MSTFTSTPSPIKHNSFPIQRPPITPDPLPPKPLLHPNPPRLIKPHSSHLHQPINLLPRPLIQSPSRILRLNILRQVEVAAVQAGLGIIVEADAVGEAGVAEGVEVVAQVRARAVEGFGDCARGG